MDNLATREKRKLDELEKKMSKAQLPTSEAIAQQVSEELDSKLPLKISRLKGKQDIRDSNISVMSKSSRSEHKH